MHFSSIVVCLAVLSSCAPSDAAIPPPLPFAAVLHDTGSVTLASPEGAIGFIASACLLGDKIVVLDESHARASVFSSRSGALMRVIGHAGDSTGDLRRPVQVVRAQGSGFAILDQGRRLVSFRDSQGGVLREVDLPQGMFNGLVVNERDGTTYLTGRSTAALDKQVHQLGADGGVSRSFLQMPADNDVLQQRYGVPFGALIGDLLAVGSMASPTVHLVNGRGENVRDILLPTHWYRAPVWDVKASASGAATDMREWLRKQRLVNGLFGLPGGFLFVRVRDFSTPGDGLYAYALFDSTGSTRLITAPTDRHVVATHGDTIVWTGGASGGTQSVSWGLLSAPAKVATQQ